MEKNINIKNVAEIAQVSISTVSRVLNRSANVSEELKERVYKAIEETKYSVNPIASTLKSAKRHQIAIVLPSLRQTYYTDIIKGASDYCYNCRIMPIILESGGVVEKEKQIIKNLEKQWIDGVIFIPSKNVNVPGYAEFLNSLKNLHKQGSQIPVVLAECSGLSRDFDCVRVDYENAFYKMTYHLLEIGKSEIAYISCLEEALLCNTSFEAYRRALEEHQIKIRSELIEYAGCTILEGYEAMKRILQRNRNIDGVICSNDQVAAGALHACKESEVEAARRIAIVGFGGVAISIITTPAITTMIVPRYDIGYEAAQILFQRINGEKKEKEEKILTSHMAIRASTLRTAAKKMDAMFAE